jgi:hypothetical protein
MGYCCEFCAFEGKTLDDLKRHDIDCIRRFNRKSQSAIKIDLKRFSI